MKKNGEMKKNKKKKKKAEGPEEENKKSVENRYCRYLLCLEKKNVKLRNFFFTKFFKANSCT